MSQMDPSRDALRRELLAAFLRSRRARLDPETVGIGVNSRRRVPGLRREEVAQLADVGITWYTWLEQGRAVHPSAQVIAAIADALRLDEHERRHLFTLAETSDPGIPCRSGHCEPPGHCRRVRGRARLRGQRTLGRTRSQRLRDRAPRGSRPDRWAPAEHHGSGVHDAVVA